MNLRRKGIAACLTLAVVTLNACTTVGGESLQKAVAFDEGASEEQLIKAAGQPTRRLAPPASDCSQRGGTHELIYEETIKYVGGWLADTPSMVIAFCIGDSSKVVQKLLVHF